MAIKKLNPSNWKFKFSWETVGIPVSIVALIVFTVLVKLALWPLMRKQLYQTRLMKKIQPELAEIKKRCKGNRQMETLQMMDLYKRNNIKPFRSILVLIIQLPIFIAIFRIVRMATEGGDEIARFAYSFVQGLPRISEAVALEGDLPISLFGIIDLKSGAFPNGGVTLSAFVLLAFVIISAFLQYLISKQQLPQSGKRKTFKQIMADAKNGEQADQSELNNVVSGQMAKLMPIMMFFIMIGMPGAVILYFMTTNILSYFQQRKIFAQDFDQMDNLADKKLIKELGNIKEAEIVKKDTKENKGTYKKKAEKSRGENITRIKASDKGGKKRSK